MYALRQITQSPYTHLTVLLPLVLREQSGFKLKISCPLKRQATQFNIKRVFSGVESDLHTSDCMYKITGSQAANDKTIMPHFKVLNKLPCNPHGYWVAEHPLFNLNIQITVANDNEWRMVA
jgi:hypothetical protein